MPKIKTFTTEDLCNLITTTADAIDNFDLDVANETLKHLSDYNLTDTQRSTLNEVKTFLNIFDYDNTYTLICNFKYNLYKNV